MLENEEPPASQGFRKIKKVGHLFSKGCHIASERKTVTDSWYTGICLPEVINKFEQKLPNPETIVLHLCNSSAYSSSKAKDPLKIQLVWYPPYIPHLAPWDYFLFPKVKKTLCSKKCATVNVALERYLTLDKIGLYDRKKFKSCFKEYKLYILMYDFCITRYFRYLFFCNLIKQFLRVTHTVMTV